MRLIAALTALVLSSLHVAAAQPARCPLCRAQYLFGNCPVTSISNPPRDAISLWGEVMAFKRTDCGVSVTVRVTRSSSPLPETIAVDVGPCSYWHGAIGETVRAAVGKIPGQTGVYPSSIFCEAVK
jgi:hypothetical protein